jgi:inositol hexakisphosphate/diphosphoinositol-pentakisphosphate kinase
MILAKLAPKRLSRLSQIPQILELKSKNILASLKDQNEEEERHLGEELRSVVAIFRHGDRTPKQKMKVKY